MRQSQASGWGIFAATMMLIIGAINLIQGLVAMVRPAYYVVEDGQTLLFNFAAWGTILGIWGVVLLATGLALLSGRMWARAVGVVLAGVNTVAQLAFLTAFPMWSLVVIAVSVVVIYALTAGWPDAQPGEEPAQGRAGGDAYSAGRADARRAPTTEAQTEGEEKPSYPGKHEPTAG